MGGVPRNRPGWPHGKPPPRNAAPHDRCAQCGHPVAPDDRQDGHPVRHLVCDPAMRAALARRIEATRAVHRAAAALSSVPAVHARLSPALAALPDACDVGDALAFLAQARTVVECSSHLTPQQRRVALSFLDASLRKLGA